MPFLIDRVRDALAGEYIVEHELASGGMGVVFKAREVALDRPVAVKVLRPELATAAAEERFHREALILANTRHASIVPIHRVGEADGFFYFVMEYMEGGTLADRLTKGTLKPREAAKLGIDLLDALDVAHRQGVLHRDIKPSNVFFRGDKPTLGDFGIAKSSTSDEALTAAGQAVGTPAYMSPEQKSGEEVTAATDIHAFGMMLYEAVTGVRWVTVTNVADPDRWVGVPRGLARVLRRALRPEPAKRWENAAAFRTALKRFMVVRTPLPAVAAILILATVPTVVMLTSRGTAAPDPFTDLAILPFDVEGDSADTDELGMGLTLTTSIHLVADAQNLDLSLTPTNHSLPWVASSDLNGAALASEAIRELRTLHVAHGRVTVSGESLSVRVMVMDSAGTVRQSEQLTGSTAELNDLGFRVGRAIVRILALDRANEFTGSRSLRGLSGPVFDAFNRGELAFESERLAVAEEWYLSALAQDSTFALAWWRLFNVRRWSREDPESLEAVKRRLRDIYERIPDQFNELDRLLIQADLATLVPERLSLYRQAIRHSPHNGDAWLLYGNELFHRGGLVGYELDSVLAALDSAIARNPFLAPAHQTKTWALIRLGLGEDAWAALQRYDDEAPGPSLEKFFIQLAWTERFQPDSADLVGPVSPEEMGRRFRLAPSFGLPGSLVLVAQTMVTVLSDPGARANAFVAQALGFVATGRVSAGLTRFDSAAAAMGGAPAFALQAAQWRVIPAVVGLPGVSELEETSGRRALEALVREPTVSVRAAWTLALSHLARADEDAAARAWSSHRDSSRPAMRAVFDAMSSATREDYEKALRLSEIALAFDVGGQGGDPWVRAITHLLRGRWFGRLGQDEEADRAWRWYLNADWKGWLEGVQQSAEVDWALEAFARYTRGMLALERGNTNRPCTVLPEVLARWRSAEPAYQSLVRDVEQAIAECDEL